MLMQLQQPPLGRHNQSTKTEMVLMTSLTALGADGTSSTRILLRWEHYHVLENPISVSDNRLPARHYSVALGVHSAAQLSCFCMFTGDAATAVIRYAP
jgi:hypothetical protein